MTSRRLTAGDIRSRLRAEKVYIEYSQESNSLKKKHFKNIQKKRTDPEKYVIYFFFFFRFFYFFFFSDVLTEGQTDLPREAIRPNG